ncbi:DUF427 domain-containing protein [Agrococcus carbonis]|uniref:Uncharacterized conserved protein, DUF427 family n=1 Tax=Agrococcus carbonis TaxID=684552 RepID=A0A1H1Q5G3_9MICO|nr:DUF427 domain-containing protein [Agrococcus carbonis]SDS18655.1 Uncharacterized conserved protein, DUF427 family [Agrococcus carbonis]
MRTVESVWDYPRPPRVEASDEHVRIVLGGEVIVETREALRVLETSHPPTYYLPREAFREGALAPGGGASACEWKGAASYFDVTGGGTTEPRAAWHYPSPLPGFESLAGHVAVYAGRMDLVEVDGERVEPQPGRFYGGWITSRVRGPFKGAPGTMGW